MAEHYDPGNLQEKEEFEVQVQRVSDHNSRVEAAGRLGSQGRVLRAHNWNLEHKAESSLQGELCVNPSKLTPRTHFLQDHTQNFLKQHHELGTKGPSAYGGVLIQASLLGDLRAISILITPHFNISHLF